MTRQLCWLALLIATAPAHAQTDTDPATSLVAAERAFALAASQRLVNDAFLTVLAEHGILFRPAPVDGRASLAQRPMAATLNLRWTPIYAETSSDGMLGFTTGPSEFGQRGQPPVGTGFFVSLWLRTGADWKLVLDCGIDAPIPAPVDSAASLLRTRALDRSFSGPADLREVEQMLIADYGARFVFLADDDVRVYRNGAAPSSTRREGVALVGPDSQQKWAPSEVVVAASGDLGYVYGVLDPEGATPRGYLRIYRRAADGMWKVAVDWHN